MEPAVLHQLLHRPPQSHKYDYGHVLVIGGAPGMVGAPFLAGRAALRIGAGLVTIASTPLVTDKLEKRVAEIMTLRLSDDARELPPFIKDRKVSVVVVGPGMKPEFAKTVIKHLGGDLPAIVDGGALAALYSEPGLIHAGMILTPHLGEFQRFFDKPPAKADLVQTASSFSKRHDIILTLKGHPTHIFSSTGKIYEDSSGGPELATAGTGDVLAGMIGGLLAQKIKPLAAARAAVRLHGLAGQIAAATKTQPGVIASDVIEAVPGALKLVLEKEL